MQIAQQMPDFTSITGGRQIFASPPSHSLPGSSQIYYGPNAYETISSQPISTSSLSHHGQVHYSNFETNLPTAQSTQHASFIDTSAQVTNEFDTYAESGKSSFINGGYNQPNLHSSHHRNMHPYPVRQQPQGRSVTANLMDSNPGMMPLSYSVPPLNISGEYNLNNSVPDDRMNYTGIDANGNESIQY